MNGEKHDNGKLKYTLIPQEVLDALAEVLTYGERKYGVPSGWQHVPNGLQRYTDAMLRHLAAFRRGELIDPESGLPHTHHLLCNAAFVAYLAEQPAQVACPDCGSTDVDIRDGHLLCNECIRKNTVHAPEFKWDLFRKAFCPDNCPYRKKLDCVSYECGEWILRCKSGLIKGARFESEPDSICEKCGERSIGNCDGSCGEWQLTQEERDALLMADEEPGDDGLSKPQQWEEKK